MRLKFTVILFVLVATGIPSLSLAQDDSSPDVRQVVRLDDGTSWRGRIGDHVTVEWKEGASQPSMTGRLDEIARLYLKITPEGSDKPRVILLSAIISLESATSDKTTSSDASSSGSDEKDAAAVPGKATSDSKVVSGGDGPEKTGIFILPLSGTVGIEFRPEEIEEITRQADERGEGQIIVLEIDSGGGLVAEGMLIKEAIYEACERHTVVAWVDHAISGASWTALCCDIIVFKRHGHTGGITIMHGNKTAPQSTVNAWIPEIAKLLREKGRSIYWARPFVVHESELSATRDPETGDVTWYPDLSGEKVFSSQGKNLMFNGQEAVDYGFAIGLANTHEELAEVLEVQNWELDGTGQELHDRRKELKEKLTDTLKKQIVELRRLGGSRSDINKKIKILQSWLRWWKLAPNQCRMIASLPPPERIKELIEELKYQLRQSAGAAGGGGRSGGGGRGGR